MGKTRILISALHFTQNIQKPEKTLCAAFKPNHT